jgi:tetratricopeptide (TPR) repeat protein
MTATPPDAPTARLWLLLIAFLYALFTLLPDSHSQMVSWPWVAIWQIGLLCPILWLLSGIWHRGKLSLLGSGFDGAIAILLLGLVISSLFSEFPERARWYSWAAAGGIATLYSLHQWIREDDPPARRYRLLLFQGYLAIAFILVSLFLWTTRTYLPELARIDRLKPFGVQMYYDFSVLDLRNWAPLGHQNYVAGYLVLAIPLLVGLGILAKGRIRWLWFTGVGLGILDLYTTGSRGGWLGLFAVWLFGLVVAAFRGNLPKRWLGLAALGSFSLLSIAILANNRLQSVALNIARGTDDPFRAINRGIGWRMGIEHPFTGIGLGNVTLVYQHYRPFSAGRFSEVIYQLHSTPAQIWAELGLWGVLASLIVVLLLIFHFARFRSDSFSDSILLWCIATGLFGYGFVCLTDYQPDNLAIAGTLVIYCACITSAWQKNEKTLPLPSKSLFFAGLGLTLAMIVWLIPIHRAWQLSNLAFAYLDGKKIEPFRDSLVRAGELDPKEPYYPYQLGANLGRFALETGNPNALNEGIEAFQRGNRVSPYWEFGYTNLGWLLLKTNPAEAGKSFRESIRLMPAKRGVFDGLARSLLSRGQGALAIEALALESLRDPYFITSPVWRSPNLQPLYGRMLDRIEREYTRLLESDISPGLKNYLYSSRGSLYWWRGDRVKAESDWQKSSDSLGLAVLNPSSPKYAVSLPASVSLLLQAHRKPAERAELLRQAWVQAKKELLPPEMEKQFLASMQPASDFETWLKEKAPAAQYFRERSGFGVNLRHTDGPPPFDFTPVVENLAIGTWFRDLFFSSDYYPELDSTLQPLREELLAKVDKLF